MMDIAKYVQEVHRTCSVADPRDLLTVSALGIAGESGEIVDLIKKVLYHEHELDSDKLCKEIGDLLWYLVLLCETTGLTLEQVMETNAAKLRKRYPEGFDARRSQQREA